MLERASGRLLVCPRSNGGLLGRPLATLALPDSGDAVMVQWALGQNVARWTRELGPLLAADPPEIELVFGKHDGQTAPR